MVQTIAATGSLAAAARALGQVPSALSYRVRQVEDALDVLLFDRSARQVRLTAAGAELLREGQRLLDDLDAVAQRVKRVATGWEPELTLAIDSIIVYATVMELCADFFALQPPTRIRLRDETLSGTLEALTRGHADLALGVADPGMAGGIESVLLGEVVFVFAVAPHHPLAQAAEPLSDVALRPHRVVAVADSVRRGPAMSIGLLPGQDVLTVSSMSAKLDAQLRGLACGALPVCMAQPYIDTGRLVVKTTQRPRPPAAVYAAWRQGPQAARGRALQWWLAALGKPATRSALLVRQRGG
ncbi:MAG: LysR family transcriptional regulator [Rhodoferax sp.]